MDMAGATGPDAEALFRTFLDAAPVGFCCFDREFRYVSVNKTLADINGLAVEEHLGRTVTEVLPEFGPAVQGILEQVLSTGEPLLNIQVAGETRAAPGKTRHWLASYHPVRGKSDRVDWICVYTREVTEFRHAEDSFREVESNYQEILDHTPCQVFAKDVEGRCFLYNTACESVWGLPRESVMGRTPRELFPGPVADQMEANHAKVLSTGNVFTTRGTFPTACGVRDFLSVLFPLRNLSGELAGVGGMCLDMTEQLTREKELLVYRHIVSSTEDALCMIDPAYTYRDANESYVRWCGTARESLLGCHVQEILGREQFDSVLKPRIDRCLAGETVRFEGWEALPAIGRRYLLTTYTPCRDDDGQIIGVVMCIRDETARRLAEDLIKASNARVKSMFDNVPIGIFESTPDGKFLYVNPAVARMHHYDSPEQLMEAVNASSIAEVLYAEPGCRPRFVREACEASPAWSAFENKYLTKDGQVIDALLTFSSTTDPVSGQQRLYGFALDITEQKKAAAELRESEERFRALFHDSVDAQVLYDESGFLDCNASAAEILGLSNREALLGLHPQDVSPPLQPDGIDSAEKAKELLARVGREGSLRFEWLCRRCDGSDIHLDVSTRKFQFKGREVFHATCRDITARKRLEEEQVRHAAELRDMNAALRVILEQREKDRERLQEQMAHNLVHLVEPYLDRIVSAAHNPAVDRYVEVIRRNLGDATGPLVKILDVRHQSLTGNEVRVASLVRQGKSSKDIARLLNVSLHTVHYYRNSIRRKLGMKGGRTNLQTVLESLEKHV